MRFNRFWNWRYPLAGFLAALALIIGVTLFLPRTTTVSTVVVRSQVCAGCEVQAKDLQQARLTPGAVPATSLRSIDEAAGKTAAVALTPGTVVQPAFLLQDSLKQLHPGEVAFTLEMKDPSLQGFSQTGRSVEIWCGGDSQNNQLLATDARILGVKSGKESLLSTSSSPDIIYLASSEESARRVIAARSDYDLFFVLRGGSTAS